MSDSDFLHAENVTKLYGADTARHEALRGISFAAERGEFVAIRGPSGCGKSTLLHILGAMDSPTDGNVWLNGRRLDTLGLDELAIVRRRYVGFIFQSFNLLPTLTVQENVSLPLLLDGVADREASERSISALADGPVVDTALRQFFSGQLPQEFSVCFVEAKETTTVAFMFFPVFATVVCADIDLATCDNRIAIGL